MPPMGFRQAKTRFHIAMMLDSHVKSLGIGEVIPLKRPEADSTGPVVCWLSNPKFALAKSADLCVEVLSPSETAGSIHEKVEEYFDCGVRVVWVVDPESRTVTVYESAQEGRLLHESASITGGDVLPDFNCRVEELFP